MRRLIVALIVLSVTLVLMFIAQGAQLSGQSFGGPLPPVPVPADNPQTDA